MEYRNIIHTVKIIFIIFIIMIFIYCLLLYFDIICRDFEESGRAFHTSGPRCLIDLCASIVLGLLM